MKKLSALVMIVVLSGFIVGCYSTGCHRAEPQSMSVKGEG